MIQELEKINFALPIAISESPITATFRPISDEEEEGDSDGNIGEEEVEESDEEEEAM